MTKKQGINAETEALAVTGPRKIIISVISRWLINFYRNEIFKYPQYANE